ncbi:MAG: hypothetical protein ACSLE0_08105 [Chitinophagaceae bacterium]
MACSIEIKTNNFLKEEEVIDKDNNILKPSLIQHYIDTLSRMAYYKYGVGSLNTSLYHILDNKLIPDSAFFELLDESTFSSEVEKIFRSDKGVKDTIGTKETNVFEEQEEEEEEELDAYLKSSVDLTKLSNKVDYALGRVQQSLIENIKRLRKITYNPYVKEEIKKSSSEKIEVLTKLLKELKNSKDGITAKGIISFVERMTSTVDYIDSKLVNLDFNSSKNTKLLINSYDNFLSSFSVVKDVQELITAFKRNPDQTYLTKEELNKLTLDLKKATGSYENTMSSLLEIKKEYLRSQLNDVKYFPRVIAKHRSLLRNEWEKIGKPGDREAYVNKHLTPGGKNWADILQDVEDAVDNLLNNPVFDINAADNWFTSPSNISNELFQIFHTQLIEIDNKRLLTEREADLIAFKIFEDLRKEKGTIDVQKLYENIIEFDKNGRMFLKGEFKSDFLIEVTEKIKQIKKDGKLAENAKLEEAIVIRDKYGIRSEEYLLAQHAVEKVSKAWKAEVERIEDANLERIDENTVLPAAKWRNSLAGLSVAEKAALEYYKGIIDKGAKSNSKESLRIYSYGALFYDTPYITKSSLERYYEGDIKGGIVEKWNYLRETRADDIEYTSDQVDLAGEQVRDLRLHYRNRKPDFKHSTKSRDLATMFRLESKNVNIYNLRREKEADFSFLIDIAKHQKLYTKNGNLLQRAFGQNNLNISTNLNNNIAQSLKNMMDYRFYDISHKSNQKWGKVDANKATNYINGATAFMALSFNFASGTANVVNANAQMFLETVLKGHTFTASNVAKANKIYFTPSVFNDTLKDNLRGINRGFVNQLSEIFNTKGLYALSESNFLQANLAKKGLDLKSLQVFQDSGEHWIQGVLMMALLDNIKVLNSNGNFINEEGKEVKTKKDAASLLDMHKVDPKSGLLNLDSSVVYTTHSPSVKYDEGGKELIDKLLRKKIDDSIGNYTQTQQADGYRHYMFKIGMLFRKYLVPMGQARLRGIETAGIAKDKLREDQTRFSHALQEYEEGTYVTLIRYGWNAMKTFKKELLTRENWNDLSEYEKHNIKRALAELMTTFVILPNAIRLMAMGAATDDDHDDEWYFLMYQTRRNITELQSYINPMEMFKMLKSPIPSMKFLEGGINTLYQSYPGNWFEEDARGKNIWLKNVNQFNPLRQFDKDFEKTFNFQNR